MNLINDIQPASVLTLFSTDKEGRKTFAENIIHQVTEGYRSPLDMLIALKNMEDILKSITSDDRFKQAVIDEAQKHGGKLEMHNATVQLREAGVKWDYSKTEDTVLAEWQQQVENLQAHIKDRQKFLQTIPEGGIADPETGAMIYRAAKSSSTTPVVTLK